MVQSGSMTKEQGQVEMNLSGSRCFGCLGYGIEKAFCGKGRCVMYVVGLEHSFWLSVCHGCLVTSRVYDESYE